MAVDIDTTRECDRVTVNVGTLQGCTIPDEELHVLLTLREIRMCHAPREARFGIAFRLLFVALLLCQLSGFRLPVLCHQVAIRLVHHVAESRPCGGPSGLQVELTFEPVFAGFRVLLDQVVQDFLVLDIGRLNNIIN